MDSIDKRVILSLLRNARTPQRRVAEDLGISAQALNYRMARLKESGIIKRYSLHVNPAVYGMKSGFAAFRNDTYESASVASRFRCFEEITIYEFTAAEDRDLDDEIRKAVDAMGEPVMRYIPEPRTIGMRIGDADRRIIDALKSDPRMASADIAKLLELSPGVVRKRLDLMEKNRVISVIAEVDLTRIDSVLYSVISGNVNTLFPAIPDQLIFAIADRDNGILVCYSDNLGQAKQTIERMRKIDPDAEVMVVYDYEFRQ